jgi:hypothetical protein
LFSNKVKLVSMKYFYVFTFIIFFVTITYGSNSITVKDSVQPFTLFQEKRAVVLAAMTTSDSLSENLIQNLQIAKLPKQYIQLKLKESSFPKPAFLSPSAIQTINASEKKLTDWLNSNQVGQQILLKWFNQKDDDYYNLEPLTETTPLTPTDLEFLYQTEPIPKSTTQKFTETPVNNTFLFVYDFEKIQSMKDFYQETGTDPDNRILNGYITTYRVYILKLDFNHAIANTFFNHLQGHRSEIVSQENNSFNQTSFPFFLVSVIENRITSTQHNENQPLAPEVQLSKEKLLETLATLVVENTFHNLELNNFDLNQRNWIEQKKSNLIGHLTHENEFKFDHRYAIYENRIQQNGRIKPERVAVVKSMKPPFIQKDSSENLYNTTFYQISGKKISGKNIYIQRESGTGLNLIAGNTYNGLSATTGRLEYYFSRTLGDMVLPGKTGKGLTSVKFYLEAGQKKNSYALNDNLEKFTFNRGSLGIGKDYYPLPFLHWGPFIGYGLEYTSWETSDNLISTNFAEMGARLGINLRHNIQVIGSGTYYLIINSVLMNGSRNVIQPNFDYFHTFQDRSGIGFNIGLRLML